MQVATLPVMHDGYRLPLAAMQRLLDHVRAGGKFDVGSLTAHDRDSATLLYVTRFEDGRMMLRDGLHRATAVMLARPSGALDPSEVIVEDMTYDMFRKPALSAGLYAPFDPQTEVRIADFRAYRDEVMRRTGDDALAYIAAHHRDYVRPRRACHDSLARFYAECSPYGSELAA
jgi:hypothetical protein